MTDKNIVNGITHSRRKISLFIAAKDRPIIPRTRIIGSISKKAVFIESEKVNPSSCTLCV
jgi:hypothetical protein